MSDIAATKHDKVRATSSPSLLVAHGSVAVGIHAKLARVTAVEYGCGCALRLANDGVKLVQVVPSTFACSSSEPAGLVKRDGA